MFTIYRIFAKHFAYVVEFNLYSNLQLYSRIFFFNLVTISQACYFCLVRIILFTVFSARNAFLLHFLMVGFLTLFKFWLRYDSFRGLFLITLSITTYSLLFLARTHHCMMIQYKIQED